MLNKIYEKSKKFIKNNYKTLLVLLFIVIIFNVNLDYEIYSPGGLLNINDRIEVKNGYASKGNFNLTYVSAKKGVLPFVLLSYIIQNWDLIPLEEERIDNESYDEIVERNKVFLEEGMNNSIIAAFEEAGEKYKVKSSKIKVLYVLEEADTDIKVGDEILTVNGNEVNKNTDITNILNNYNENDIIKVKILRNGKEKEVDSRVSIIEGEKIIGLLLVNIYDIDTYGKIDIKYKNNEGGSSGGLMNALYIYDSLIKEDLTKGLSIAGTGTIDEEGNVGDIGGVKYKILGASKNKADVFLTPYGNYEEAVKVKKDYDLDIKVIKIKTLKEAIKKLQEL